ncbi:MAG TPA: 4-alpha-glucanotransferase, partial [Verrucomicrobiae bacterium]|nr:4-alpha-glucanotransferase [Verrucomicrobiae bacterium]
HGMAAGVSRLAASLGIQTDYIDMSGAVQRASPEALKPLLRLWDIEVETPQQARDALRERLRANAARIIEPVLTPRDGRPALARLRIPLHLTESKAVCTLRFENGEEKRFDVRFSELKDLGREADEGGGARIRGLVLPVLPLGYHHLTIEAGGRRWTSLIICAPAKVCQPEHDRAWGAFLPMYAAHSRKSWGAGNLGDWRTLTDMIARAGGSVMGTLPLTATCLEKSHCLESPYSPASRLFWNEFYLDFERVPEFRKSCAAQRLFRSKGFQSALAGFRQSPLVDYEAEAAARRRMLEEMTDEFWGSDSSRFHQFQKWVSSCPLARDYAAFRATMERAATPWQHWEPRQRYGKLQAGDFDERDLRRHLYAQWLMHGQMAEMSKACKSRDVQLYLDLPVGVSGDSFDVWHEQRVFAVAASVGAPPDMFFSGGQNWGFPPLHPDRIREDGYRYIIDYLRFQMETAGMLRIDHVMGLHRLFWIPPGFSAKDGAYVRYPAEEWAAILCLESHRNRTRVIGENLGIVPPEVNEMMKRRGLGQMYVLQFEMRAQRAALRPPPVSAVASLDTHDTPTFAARWKARDIEQRLKLKLLSRGEAVAERKRRAGLKQALAEFLERKGLLARGEREYEPVLRACLRWLGQSPAELVLVNLEDLWGEEQPQNVPGTVREYPNWRRKARLAVEAIRSSRRIRALLREVDSDRKQEPFHKRLG